MKKLIILLLILGLSGCSKIDSVPTDIAPKKFQSDELFGSDSLFENYTTGQDETYEVSDNGDGDDIKQGQIFTADSNHSITSIKFIGYRQGSFIGTLTAEIYGTSSGLPTGSPLASGSIAGNSVGESPGSTYEIIMVTPCDLVSGTVYALVLSGSGFGVGNYILWRGDKTSPTYTGGNRVQANPTTWVAFTGVDLMFEIYGIAEAPPAPTYNVQKINGVDTTSIQKINGQNIGDIKKIKTVNLTN